MTSRDIRDLTPFLQRVFFNMRAWYVKHFPQRTLILTCTYRDVAEQQLLYASGRFRKGSILTNCDGVKTKSMHNYRPAKAFDFAVVINGKARWNPAYYDSCWLFFRDAKLTKKVRWGRNFTTIKDRPHIEEV